MGNCCTCFNPSANLDISLAEKKAMSKASPAQAAGEDQPSNASPSNALPSSQEAPGASPPDPLSQVKENLKLRFDNADQIQLMLNSS